MKNLTYLLVLIFFISCNKSNEVDCATVTCLSPSIIIDLKDDNSKENFISLNNLETEDISIQNSLQNSVDFNIDKNTGILIITKQNNTETIIVQINQDITLTISYETSAPKTNGCCDFGELTNINVLDKNFEIIEGVITIYL